MGGHTGAHRCSDPRCGGFDRATIFKRIAKHSAQVVQVFGEPYPFVYSIGFYANHMLPELFLKTQVGANHEDLIGFSMLVLTAADYLSTLPTVGAGTRIPADRDGGAMWLWDLPHIRNDMGIARDYYREKHLTPINNVPCYALSIKPHPEERPEINDAFDWDAFGPVKQRVFRDKLNGAIGRSDLA